MATERHRISAEQLIEQLQSQINQLEQAARSTELSQAESQLLQQQVQNARQNLNRYESLLSQGQLRTSLLAPIGTVSTGVLATDLTGVGVLDNVALIPLGFAALGTLLLTQAPASQETLRAAYNDVKRSLDSLAISAESVRQQRQATSSSTEVHGPPALTQQQATQSNQQQATQQSTAQRQQVRQAFLNFEAQLPAEIRDGLDGFYNTLVTSNNPQARAQLEQITQAYQQQYGQVALQNNDQELGRALLHNIMLQWYEPSNYQFQSLQRQAETQAYLNFEAAIPTSTKDDIDGFFSELSTSVDPASRQQATQIENEVQARYGRVATSNDNPQLTQAILHRVVVEWFAPSNYQFQSLQRQAATQAYLDYESQLPAEVRADMDAFYQQNPAEASKISNAVDALYGQVATSNDNAQLAEAIQHQIILEWYAASNYLGKSSVVAPPAPTPAPPAPAPPAPAPPAPAPPAPAPKGPIDLPIPTPVAPTGDPPKETPAEPLNPPPQPPEQKPPPPHITIARMIAALSALSAVEQANIPEKVKEFLEKRQRELEEGEKEPEDLSPKASQDGEAEQEAESSETTDDNGDGAAADNEGESTAAKRLHNIREQLSDPAKAEFDSYRQTWNDDEKFLEDLTSNPRKDAKKMFEGIARNKNKEPEKQAQSKAALKEAQQKLDESGFFEREDVQEAIANNHEDKLRELMSMELTTLAKAEEFPPEQGYEQLEGVILYEVVPGYSSIDEWKADHPGEDPRQIEEKDGKIYRPAGEIDLTILHRSAEGEPATIEQMLEVKSGDGATASGAKDQLRDRVETLERIQNGEDVYVSHQGRDITDEIDISSASKDKTVTRGPDNKTAYDERVGLNAQQFKKWAKEILRSSVRQQSQTVIPEQNSVSELSQNTNLVAQREAQQEFDQALAELNEAISGIETYDPGYPVTFSTADISDNLARLPASEQSHADEAILFLSGAQQLSNGPEMLHTQNYVVTQNEQELAVYRPNDLPIASIDSNQNIVLHEPLKQPTDRGLIQLAQQVTITPEAEIQTANEAAQLELD